MLLFVDLCVTVEIFFGFAARVFEFNSKLALSVTMCDRNMRLWIFERLLPMKFNPT